MTRCVGGGGASESRWLMLAMLASGLLTAPAGAAASKPVALGEIRGLDGQPISLAAPVGGATVLVFYSTECPISNSISPALNEIVGAFPVASLKMIGICVDPDLSDADVSRHGREFGLKFPVARDRRGILALRLGAKVTPEAFVVDAQSQVRYQGRIDDQFAARQKRNAHPTSHELRDAIAAVLAGREVAAAFVEPVGCPLPEAPRAAGAPTFTRDVALLLQKHCQTCHRVGQVGPFPLLTYEQASKRAKDIARVVGERRMPPWKPVPGFGQELKHPKSLSEREVATLVAWAEGGAPEGDPADLPPPAKFSDDWSLGTPDLVLEPAEGFSVPATGEDIYRCFVIPTNLPKDVDIAAVEFQPGNRRVVHHVLCYVDTTGKGRERDQADPGP
ncbi:MAG TPA: redoxin domain-containing protein, partial [Isosphaeraceae bacterium]|nr:redoxin domain-containing protein [Isosphaeraceae bacterium]